MLNNDEINKNVDILFSVRGKFWNNNIVLQQ
jgi:hypothetical protein